MQVCIKRAKLEKDIQMKGCGIEVEILFDSSSGGIKRLQRIARTNVDGSFHGSQPQMTNKIIF